MNAKRAGTPMKSQAELTDGPEAFDRFKAAVKSVLTVPKDALPPKPRREKKKTHKPKA
jgi:hypothetical protein